MQSSLGKRVITENGPITNLLAYLDFIDQIRIAIICKRTYQITVANNTLVVKLPIDRLCDFPGLKIPSDDFVCKRIKATIEGESGEFFGIVRKLTDLPDGYGVFKAGDWVHCGEVKDEKFLDGRRVSVNKAERLLKLTNQKCLSDGSVLEKVELFSKQGLERNILKDGQKIETPIPRLNPDKDVKNWLSMQPNPLMFTDFYDGFGELDENNRLHGRGICILSNGDILIGYFENGR
jgi:hypothetical protein